MEKQPSNQSEIPQNEEQLNIDPESSTINPELSESHFLQEISKDIDQEIDQQRKLVQETTQKNSTIDLLEQEKSPSIQQPSIVSDPELVKHQIKKTMQDIEHQLNHVDKSFSKIINQPIIDKSSDILSKTIFRSSGLLGGSIMAFLGSIAYLVFVNYTGITYNYQLFFIFLISGFVIGIILEYLIRLLKRNS